MMPINWQKNIPEDTRSSNLSREGKSIGSSMACTRLNCLLNWRLTPIQHIVWNWLGNLLLN